MKLNNQPFMNVWDFFRTYFKEAEESSISKPLIHESIVRDEKELQSYRAWKESLEHRRSIDWLNNQYALWQALPNEVDDAILFLNTPSSKGFAVHFIESNLDLQHAAYLFDFLKEKVLTLNYRPQVSDTRTWSDKKAVQTLDRYYLKPRTSKTSEGKINQLFGNITIELLYRDNTPFNLKFRATAYHDRLYQPADDFQFLMEGILS
ncbi:MAG: hypothetical protein R2825_24770 [Saprospiraceae bacterium]